MVRAASMFIFLTTGLVFVASIAALAQPIASPAIWMLAGISGTGFVLMFVMFILSILLRSDNNG